MERDATVFVVDDDPGVLASLRWLLESDGLNVDTYPSANRFLEDFDPDSAGCLILDVRMPGMDGLELQEKLQTAGARIPIIFVSGHGDVPHCVRAIKGGAVDFLEKPADGSVLLERVHEAIRSDFERRKSESEQRQVAARIRSLTPRERDVLPLLLHGKAIKYLASQLDVSIQTAAKHRTRVLQKMGVDNEAELVLLVKDQSLHPLG